MKRFLPHLLWICGIGVIVAAVIFFGHHGVPYQDATPEQEASREAGLANFRRVSLLGSALFVTGILWVATRSVRDRDRPRE